VPVDGCDDAARDRFFGELYYETTAELLTPRLTEAETALVTRCLGLKPHHRVVDLGCGHGRHLKALSDLGIAGGLGLERSSDYLRRARAAGVAAPLVRGDLRALPFAAGRVDAAFAWYSALFLFDEATNAAVLEEVARILRPGGRLLHHGASPARLAADPTARHVGRTRAGGRVEEVARYDAASGREHLWRRLIRPGGEVLEGAWSVRHYPPDELAARMAAAGLVLEAVLDERGAPYEAATSLDLVAVARRPEGL
jgi:SAM-dependent methyltransferase